MNLDQIASELANRMEAQRTKWFHACIEGMKLMAKNFKDIQVSSSSLKEDTDSMIKSFQLVHILSFVGMRGYLNSSEIGRFTNLLCDAVCGADLDKCLPYINRYTELKKEKRGEQFHEQFLTFAEDLALSIAGAPEGILLSSGVDVTVFDFYTRNLALAAIEFGDDETYNHLLKDLNGRKRDNRSI